MKSEMPGPIAAIAVALTVVALGFLGWFFFLRDKTPTVPAAQAQPLAANVVPGQSMPSNGNTAGSAPTQAKD